MVGMDAITLYPYILFAATSDKVDIELIRHELIHVRQVRKMGRVQFYTSYLKQMAKGFIRTQDFNKAYTDNEHEKEAYAEQHTPFTDDEIAELKVAGVTGV